MTTEHGDFAPPQGESISVPVPVPVPVPVQGPSAGGQRRQGRGPRRRRRQALFVVGLALASAGVGVVVGKRLKSPADAASDRAAPVASLITVPVEKRKLQATLTMAAEIQYVEPTAVRLAGAVGVSAGEAQVVTRIPDPEAELADGGLFLEVSGRPVFAMTGELPMYRQLVPGSKGSDVLQLETALNNLGFSSGAIDDLYDSGTEAAVDAFYASRGYTSEGASDAQRKELTDGRAAVTDAEDALRRAKVDLAKGTTTVSASDKLAAQQAVAEAQAAVPEAQASAQRGNDEATRTVVTDTGLRNNAKAAYEAQKAIVDAAAVVSAINPETGEAYSAAELAAMRQTVLDRERELLQAEQVLATSVAAQQNAAAAGQNAVAQAQRALLLEQTRLSDLTKPADTTALNEAVTAANNQVVAAQAVLTASEAAIGTIVPAGEIVFLPRLPTSITVQYAEVGFAPPTDELAQVSSTETQIVGRIAKVDADLIQVGTAASIVVRDAGIDTVGTVTAVRPPKADPQNPGSASGSGDRLEVLIEAEDQARLVEFSWAPVKVSITVSATDDEVLAVPVAAITVAPDGTSRIEIERQRALGTKAAATELVEVTVGLSAQGYAEITPVGGVVVVGDRVIVGTETGQRRRSRSSSSTTSDTVAADTATPSTGAATGSGG